MLDLEVIYLWLNPIFCVWKLNIQYSHRWATLIETAAIWKAVWLTPLWHAQRYRWHHCDMHSGIVDTTVTCSAESLTLLCMSQRCQCNCCACHSRVNDTAVQCAAESDFCIKTVFRIIHENIRQNWLHSGVIDTAVICKAVSLTPLWYEQRCHWHRCSTNFVYFLREFKVILKMALTQLSGAYGGSCLMKKTIGKKSRFSVTLRFWNGRIWFQGRIQSKFADIDSPEIRFLLHGSGFINTVEPHHYYAGLPPSRILMLL
jgi:hypothetical protein